MLAVHTDTRILYALKVVPKAKITTQKQVEQILAESKILKYVVGKNDLNFSVCVCK